MSNANAMIRCTCCQAELTMPQFHNGYPYGYTCITKVSGQKRSKVVYTPVEYTVLSGANTQRQIVKVTAYGQTKKVVFYVSSDSETMTIEAGNVNGAYYQNGVLFVSEEHLKRHGFNMTPVAIEEKPQAAPSAMELLLKKALQN